MFSTRAHLPCPRRTFSFPAIRCLLFCLFVYWSVYRLHFLAYRVTQKRRRLKSGLSDMTVDKFQSYAFLTEVKRQAKERLNRDAAAGNFDKKPALSTSDLRTLESEITTKLKLFIANAHLQEVRPKRRRDYSSFMCHLLTLTLIRIPPPRKGSLESVRVHKHFRWSGRYQTYVLDIPSASTKSKRPFWCLIPKDLVAYYQFYVKNVRKHLRADVMDDRLWPTANLSYATKRSTQSVLGRAVSAHHFRGAVVTLFAEAGASDAQMRALARAMDQSFQVQQKYYEYGKRDRLSATLTSDIGQYLSRAGKRKQPVLGDDVSHSGDWRSTRARGERRRRKKRRMYRRSWH